MNVIKVGMADLNTVTSPGILVSLGLGSCVGIALYDGSKKLAGLAHIMLPSSKLIANNENGAKFADTGIEILLDMMMDRGAKKENITAKIAGGAQMFSFQNKSNDLLNIGERNIRAVTDVLDKFRIPILAQDVGGNFGRTIEFYAETGVLVVKTINYGTKEI